MSDLPLRSLLLDAMAEPFCPVCSVLDSMLFDELCHLQRQAVVDPETHAAVVASGGYCADHFWCLHELASPVTNAELLAPLVDRVAEHLTAFSRALHSNPSLLRHGAGQLRTRLGACVSCRVCERVALWQGEAVQSIVAIMADSDARQRYGASRGLCVPHVALALSRCTDRTIADHLLDAAVEQSRRLADDLRTYVRKWKQKDRRAGAEDAAPRCAVDKLVGPRHHGGHTT
jgi:hypothetical protein